MLCLVLQRSTQNTTPTTEQFGDVLPGCVWKQLQFPRLAAQNNPVKAADRSLGYWWSRVCTAVWIQWATTTYTDVKQLSGTTVCGIQQLHFDRLKGPTLLHMYSSGACPALNHQGRGREWLCNYCWFFL